MKSKRKQVDRKKWLQFVVDFIEKDFTNLSRVSKEKLIDKLVYFTHDPFPCIFGVVGNFDFYKKYYRTHYCPPPEDRDPELKERFALAESNLVKIKEDLCSMLQGIQDNISTESQDTWKNYPLSESSAMLSMESYFIGETGKFQVRFRPKEDKDLVAWAKLRLAELLEGLRVWSIMKCKGCSTYFLNLTEKKKIYCTSSCAQRSIHKCKREKLKKENPDQYREYLDKQGDYYWKKKMAEYPNIKRPPRKRRILL